MGSDCIPHQTENQYLAAVKKGLAVRPFFTILEKFNNLQGDQDGPTGEDLK